MKKTAVAFLVLGALTVSAPLLMAQHGEHASGTTQKMESADHSETQADTTTIQGEVVDITCYIRHESKGEKHVACAESCANMGMPLGVLEDGTNKLFLIIPPGHEDPKQLVMPFLGKKVKIDAVLYAMGGLTGVEIQKIEELKHMH